MERVLCMHDNVYNDSHTGHEAEDTHDTSNCVKHASALQVVKKMSDDQESLSKVSAFCLLAMLSKT